MSGRAVKCHKHCRVSFGSCVEASQANDKTNTPEQRMTSAIHLGALDASQAGHEAMNLNMGR